MNFFTKMTLGAVVVLIAAVSAVLLFRSREAGRVEDLIRQAVGWAAAGEAKRVEDLIAPDFESGGWNAETARAEIRRRVRPRVLEKLEAVSVEARIDGDEARVTLVLKWPLPDADLKLEAVERMEIRLRKREGIWKVVGYQQSLGRGW